MLLLIVGLNYECCNDTSYVHVKFLGTTYQTVLVLSYVYLHYLSRILTSQHNVYTYFWEMYEHRNEPKVDYKLAS